MKTIILVEIEHDKPIDDLCDKVAQRAYTLQGVKNTEAKLITHEIATGYCQLDPVSFIPAHHSA